MRLLEVTTVEGDKIWINPNTISYIVGTGKKDKDSGDYLETEVGISGTENSLYVAMAPEDFHQEVATLTAGP